MTHLQQISFGYTERASRAFIGFMLLIISFSFAISTATFAAMHLAAMYPLLTALVAWDPVYIIVETVRQRLIEYSIFH